MFQLTNATSLGDRIRARVRSRLDDAFSGAPQAPAGDRPRPSRHADRPPMPVDRPLGRRRGEAATLPLEAAGPAPKARGEARPTDGGLTPEAVLEATNAVRAEHGLPPLKLDPALSAVAQGHSEDMAARGFFDHTNPDGLDPFARMQQAGITYGAAAENIAAGQPDVQAVLDAWMNSEGHRANILNPAFTTLGVGIAEGPNGPIWTQNFTG